MALPFDLRQCASFGDDASAGASSASANPSNRNRQLPKRGIALSADIVAGVQAHDVEAFRDLVRVMYTPLVRFAETIIGSCDDAEDVVQDVLTIVWELGERWTPSTEPVGYLFASVRNHALLELRRRSRSTRRAYRAQDVDATEAEGHTPDPAIDALDELINAESEHKRNQDVSKVLATLNERQRSVYELRYVQGLPVAVVAEAIGVTVKSAEHLVARVALKVAERLRGMTRRSD